MTEPVVPVAERAIASPESQLSSHLSELHNRQSETEAILSNLETQRNALALSVLRASKARDQDASNDVTDSPESGAQQPSQQDIDAALSTARSAIRDRIALLTKYNDIKDIGQGLMGLIAEQRGCRVVDVMESLGVEDEG